MRAASSGRSIWPGGIASTLATTGDKSGGASSVPADSRS